MALRQYSARNCGIQFVSLLFSSFFFYGWIYEGAVIHQGVNFEPQSREYGTSVQEGGLIAVWISRMWSKPVNLRCFLPVLKQEINSAKNSLSGHGWHKKPLVKGLI